MQQVNVGIIGFGTVGAGTVEVLLNNRDVISSRVGSDIIVKRIADLDLDSDRGIPLESGLLTREAMEVIEDPDIHVV
ncbi:MAG: homoserine dehydrogenase, partial [Desulfobacteraceae bacterium]